MYRHQPILQEAVLEKRIKDRYSTEIEKEAAGRFGADDLEELGGFESFILKFRRDELDYVLRIAHTFRRTPGMIRGEVDWIRYLAARGVPVADAVPSLSGNLVEEVPDGFGGSFLATAFKMVKGRTPWEYGWSKDLFFRYGKLIGKLHRLSSTYSPTENIRPHWNSHALGGDLLKMVPPDQPVVRKRLMDLERAALSLPVSRDSYGLVHFDAHGGNLLIDETGTINLFDFDDCCMSWFANDIAIVLFYMVTNIPEPEKLAEDFLNSFLSGYALENRLNPDWLEHIPLFLSIREADLYSVIHRSMNVEDLSGWVGAFMEGRREKIEEGVPYLNMNFSGFGSLLN